MSGRQCDILGAPRISVLAVNVALDRGDTPVATAPVAPAAVAGAGRWVEYALFTALVVGFAWPLGRYLARVFDGGATRLDAVLRPVERGLHRLFAVRPDREMSAGVHLLSFTLFGVLGTGLLPSRSSPRGRFLAARLTAS